MSDRQFPEAPFAAPFPAKPKLDQKHPGLSVLSLPETKGSMADAETEAKRISQDYRDSLKSAKNHHLAKFIAQHKFDPKYQPIWPLIAKTLLEKHSPQALCRFLDDLV